ncbi:hypothetical protein AGMMS49983_21150 [Clostridia bacterium]|nr:hypothetical protein AGMMS49983_21150 [Clostridia bacterium]
MALYGYDAPQFDCEEKIELSIGALRKMDLSHFVFLELKGDEDEPYEFEDISFLRLFPNLVRLYMYNAFPKSLSVLTELKYLSVLEFVDSSVKNINEVLALRHLVKLEFVRTKAFPDGVLNRLENLHEIAELHLQEENLIDISALATLVNLSHLSLRGNNKLSDIRALSNLKRLEFLDVRDTSVNDYSPLRMLKNMKELRIGEIFSDYKFSTRTIWKIKSLIPRKCKIVINNTEADKKDKDFIEEMVELFK